MASYTGIWSKHAQLVAATIDTVTLDSDYARVEVINRDGTAEIFFTVDGGDPTVLGDNTHVVPASISKTTVHAFKKATTVVRLISSGTPKYTVRGTTE
jgi:hypothetical protein